MFLHSCTCFIMLIRPISTDSYALSSLHHLISSRRNLFQILHFFSDPPFSPAAATLSPHFPAAPPALKEISYSRHLLPSAPPSWPQWPDYLEFSSKTEEGEKSENISRELVKVWVERFFTVQQPLHANAISNGEEEDGDCDDVVRKQFGRIGRVGLRRVGGEKLRRPIADEAHRRQFGHCCPTRSWSTNEKNVWGNIFANLRRSERF